MVPDRTYSLSVSITIQFLSASPAVAKDSLGGAHVVNASDAHLRHPHTWRATPSPREASCWTRKARSDRYRDCFQHLRLHTHPQQTHQARIAHQHATWNMMRSFRIRSEQGFGVSNKTRRRCDDLHSVADVCTVILCRRRRYALLSLRYAAPTIFASATAFYS